MAGGNKTVLKSELKRLLYDLLDKQPYTSIRIRLIGELWQQNFVQIFSLAEDQIIFYDEIAKRLLRVVDLATVMQFELDHNFQQYLAYFHYNIIVDDKVL